ncbi:hypothetical protein [Glutamicibacter sp. NPDC087344]|uniref:hypothetical protein n=1 Tax=Glutamicibacter sp. NPDC087344 TaxID=3363994 RepID=UPI003809B754
MNIRDFFRRPDEPVPGGLLISQLLWALAGLLFVGFGGFLIVEQSNRGSLDLGSIALVLVLLAAGVAFGILGYRLFLGQRSARAQLTWVGLIAALPMALRMGRYSILAAIVLFSVALMWAPASNRYFKIVSPKPRKRPPGPRR